MQGILEQPRNLGQQRLFRCRGDADAQRTRSNLGTREDSASDDSHRGQRFSGDQALIDLGSSLDHVAIDSGALARTQQNDIAWPDGGNGNGPNLLIVDEFRRGFRLERGKVSCKRASPAAHVVVEIAPGKQERDQHDRGIEVGMVGV